MSITEIEDEIAQLSPAELMEMSRWFVDFRRTSRVGEARLAKACARIDPPKSKPSRRTVWYRGEGISARQ